MGGLVSSPVDAATKQEMEDLIKAILKTFTLEYTKGYALNLVQKLRDDSNAPPPEEWKLQERPPWNKDYKMGWLMKEGGIRKNWKKRYFVVRPNYSIDYYETDVEFNKGEKAKKRGTISMWLPSGGGCECWHPQQIEAIGRENEHGHFPIAQAQGISSIHH
jgi:hypothetical protein